MLHRTEAIVLRTIPFSEADLIVTFFSTESGLIRTFAKSPRKVKSRFGSSLEPLTHAHIAYWGKEDAALPRLTQADIIRPFQGIREQLEAFLRVSEMVEITLHLLPERDRHRDVFNLFRDVLSAVEDLCRAVPLEKAATMPLCSALALYYKVRLLDFLGYGPLLSGCARCGTGGRDFFVSHGSVVCPACAEGRDPDRPIRLSGGVVSLYETLRKWDNPGKLGRIRPSDSLVAELARLLDAHLGHTLPRPLKAPAAALPFGKDDRTGGQRPEKRKNLDRTG